MTKIWPKYESVSAAEFSVRLEVRPAGRMAGRMAGRINGKLAHFACFSAIKTYFCQ